jgi:hypothetical protein
MNAAMRPTSASVIHGSEPYRSAQGSVYAAGVSSQTVDSKSLFSEWSPYRPGSVRVLTSTSTMSRRSMC